MYVFMYFNETLILITRLLYDIYIYIYIYIYTYRIWKPLINVELLIN